MTRYQLPSDVQASPRHIANDLPEMPVKTAKARIVELAKQGVRPKEIQRRMGPNYSSHYISLVICEARKHGEDIPRFGSGPYSEPQEAPRPKPMAVVPLNHSELAALKKLCGEHRPVIEEAADRAGLSIEAYVRRLIAQHAERLRG